MADTPRQLRDIEILTQQQMEHLESEGQDDVTLREIQKILYSTEVRCLSFGTNHHYWIREQEGFEVPEGEEQNGAIVDEEETF
jgi:RP/EB family microtubule-associated protein